MNNHAHNIPPQTKIILWYMERNPGRVIRTVDIAMRFHCTAPYAHRALETLTEAGLLVQARADGVLGYIVQDPLNETSAPKDAVPYLHTPRREDMYRVACDDHGR